MLGHAEKSHVVDEKHKATSYIIDVFGIVTVICTGSHVHGIKGDERKGERRDVDVDGVDSSSHLIRSDRWIDRWQA